MTEKIGIIKNPMTIIAIFAGIAEVSGTVVLPFISDTNQLTFIYFLIAFPSVLVTIFFLTLNFNNKALYAPSDFLNEENYIKIFKYDISRQEKVEIRVTSEEMFKLLNDNVLELKNSSAEKLLKIENHIKSLKEKDVSTIEEEDDDYTFSDHPLISISNFQNAIKLKHIFTKKGYSTEIYSSYDNPLRSYSENESIWLGKRVPFELAKDIIMLSKKYYPHLIYIDLVDNEFGAPDYINDTIYIGGSSGTAKESGLKAMKTEDFNRLFLATTIKEFHNIVLEFKG